jgi:O-antigen/teichoic acid export membrane protein
MKAILVKNSVFGLGQAVINLLLVFFVVPVFMRMLGSESYGVFALVMVIGNLNTFTNLGLTSALVKFIAEQGRSEESNADIVVNLVLMTAVSLPLTLIAIYFDKFVLLDILNVPENLLGEAKWLYFWVLWANFILLAGQVFKSILDALQHIYITSFQQLIYNLVYWGLILTALLLGYNLSAIGLAIFIAAAIWLIITITSSLKEWGKISFTGLNRYFKNAVRKQLNYGVKIYAGGVINFCYEPLSKILISHFIGVTEVGFYDIALRLRSQLWGFIAKIFYPLFPFISEQKNIAIVRKYVHDLEQKTFIVVVPIIAIVILLMHPFIGIWLGKHADIISLTAIVIISFHLIGSTVIPNYQFLMAKDLAQKTIYLQLSNVVMNAIVFLFSVHYLGYYALILGNVAAIMSSFMLSLYYQKKYLNSLIFDSISQVVKLAALLLILVLTGYFVEMLLGGNNILMLMIVPIILVPATILLYKLLGIVRLDDIHRYFGNGNRISKILTSIYNT